VPDPSAPFDPLCHVPGGPYPIGDDAIPASRPAHTLTLPAFSIAACAVTNAQFAAFVEAGGYAESRWWTASAWRWRQSRDVSVPAFFADPRFNRPDAPVVGIGWYEALAYTNWLAHITDQPWRLPTEVEWEAAARDPENPDALPDPQIANSAERGIGHPLSVWGSGPVSWCGAHHMLGNVWEWTSSRWGRNWQSLDYAYPYDPTDGREDPTGSHARVMRGGSWFDSVSQSHPAVRARYLPGSRGSNIGFRLAKL
jgi:iron(II)-dependent oxidoreductase